MTHRYAALFSDTAEVEFHADSIEEAKKMAETLRPFQVVSVTPLLPCVDWTKPILDVHELSALLNCSLSTIYALVRQKKLPLSRPFGTTGAMLFRRESIEKLMAATETLPDAMQDEQVPRVLKFKQPA